MADDIEIVEHDVLENAVLKNIFPDISVIKKEISDYYEDVPVIKQEPEVDGNNGSQLIPPDHVIKVNEDINIAIGNHCSSSQTNINTSNVSRNETENLNNSSQNTKIILGSKPNINDKKTEDAGKQALLAQVLQNKQQIAPNTESISKLTDINGQSEHIHSTKIILGSKPVQEPPEKDSSTNTHNRKESMVRIPKVILQDLGQNIYDSNRYCKECKTLFQNKLDFFKHKQNSHAKKTNDSKIMKTRKTNLNIKVMLRDKVSEYIHKCPICGACFNTLFRLSKHHRNIHEKKLPSKSANSTQRVHACSICGSAFTEISNLRRHFRSYHKKVMFKVPRHNNKTYNNIGSQKVSESPIHNQNKTNRENDEKVSSANHNNGHTKTAYKCNICESRFSRMYSLTRHYKNIHKKQMSFRPISCTNRFNNSKNPVVHTSPQKSKQAKSETSSSSDSNSTCFHCDQKFTDKDSLIDHIYKIIGSKNIQSQSKKSKDDITLKNTNNKISSTDKSAPKPSKDKVNFKSHEIDHITSSYSKQKLAENEERKINKKQFKEVVTSNKKHGKSNRNCDKDSPTIDTSFSLIVAPKNKRKFKALDGGHKELTKMKRKALNITENQESVLHQSAEVNEGNMKCTKNTTKIKKVKSKVYDKKIKNQKAQNERLCFSSENKHSELEVESNGLYQCKYCSYLLPTLKLYCVHMIEKHDVVNMSECCKVLFDGHCKHCPTILLNTRSYNSHIYHRHNDLYTKFYSDNYEAREWENGTPMLPHSEFKKVKSFVLKSVIFRCGKCGVHFLSSHVAKDHQKHMELLVNWKCKICNKSFKKHDRVLHLKQHTISKTMNVYNFSEKELSRILYNCPKCSIHFTEERYLEHYPKCEIQSTDSVYCKKCDILIDNHGLPSHEDCHKIGENTEDFIIITEDILPAKKREHRSEFSKKRQTLFGQMKCLTFCDSCKCFLSRMAVSHKTHSMRTCVHIVKYTCNLCGLVFTNKSINTHRDYHKLTKNLKLQDFKFFDFKGVQILPPIPDYPRCENCDVSFIHRNLVKTHICSQTPFMICQICNVKYSESAYKLHMNFHTYCMQGLNKSVSHKKSIKCQKLSDKQPDKNDPGKSSQDNSNNNSKIADDSLNKNNLKSKTEDLTIDINNESDVSASAIALKEYIEFNKQDNDICDKIVSKLDSCEDSFESNEIIADTVSLAVKTYICKEVSKECEIKSKTSTNILEADLGTESEHNQVTTKNHQFYNFVLLYYCQFCEIALVSYDKVVEHCHNHFSPTPTNSVTFKICTICNIQFEADGYNKHQELHLTSKTNEMKYLTFDPTYFTAGLKIWTQHIFASVTPSEQKDIIEKSTYMPECRIKMDIIQRGNSGLSLYKCCKCGNFIDQDLLIDHLKEICHKKLRKFPCSVCGLPLNSSEFRTKHEEIHKRYDDIQLKSYNIAMINCAPYKSFNDSMLHAIDKYVLYQCRTCDGIVDQQKRLSHQCDNKDLQKCMKCGLIFYNQDFERHITKHRDIPMYVVDNMKVVLFGNNERNSTDQSLYPSFAGVVCDYKLFRCEICEVCVGDNKYVARHICVVDESKWKCPKCNLYICSRSIKRHIKMHDYEIEFQIDNIEIISFRKDTSISNGYRTTENGLSEPEIGHDRSTEISSDITKLNEKNVDYDQTVVLYKCACGLHFLNEASVKAHNYFCPPKCKIPRQKCSKCGLEFNPKELFAHIVAHHGDKSKIVTFNIIEFYLSEKPDK